MSRGLRICIPERVSRSGAGLGNELHGWAKAYLAAEALDAHVLAPAWGRNPRGYRRYFGASRLDWLFHDLLRSTFPRYIFDEKEYLATGVSAFSDAVRAYASMHALLEKPTYVLSTGGMWGGMSILRPAFPFVRKVLLSSTGTIRNLANVLSRIPDGEVVIAMHVRLGEFSRHVLDPQRPPWSQWNWAVPLDWFIEVCRSVRDQLDVPHSFLLFTDGSPDELDALIREISPITLFDQRMNVCSDLLAMASADVLICSRSSFSIWAAALSGRPYIWPAEGLYPGPDYLAVWDHGAPTVGSERPESQKPRGAPVGSSGMVPSDVIRYLESAYSRKALSTDLVFYGRVPR
jgi:hypothetical protein